MKYEKELRFLDKLSKSEAPIIVEGLKDKRVLSKLGIKHTLDISGKSLDSIVEKLSETKIKNVVVLTDFDKEGVKKQKLLIKLLNCNGIKADETTRRRFKQTFLINKVEELNYFIKKFSLHYNLL